MLGEFELPASWVQMLRLQFSRFGDWGVGFGGGIRGSV